MTDRAAFEAWAKTQPPYQSAARAFAWSVWQDAREDLRAQQAELGVTVESEGNDGAA